MKMKILNSGRLRAIGYDPDERHLHVQFDNGDTLRYFDVSEDLWRRFSTSSSPWSFHRDNIEEEFAFRRISDSPPNWQKLFDKHLAKE